MPSLSGIAISARTIWAKPLRVSVRQPFAHGGNEENSVERKGSVYLKTLESIISSGEKGVEDFYSVSGRANEEPCGTL